MDDGSVTVMVFVLGLLAGVAPAAAQPLDVCATCHVNATCDDKADGSGKVCNCKYGFVGNGRTLCQDKDECQIGANKICGQHTTCHNTYGSYYCTCLSGYSPSNNMGVFIPNDGTHCQDVDECRTTGLCGEGGQCRNLDGSFDCSCSLGYRVFNGLEPFNPHRDAASCKVVDCGRPVSPDDAVLLSLTGTTYGSVARFACGEGFTWKGGGNSSECGADGLWRGAATVCEEVDCGPPPAFPHSRMLWNESSRSGAEVLYTCRPGYHNVGEGNVSVCTASGRWETPSVLCRETVCGRPPPVVESTERVWSGNSTRGSTALYFCKEGFHSNGGRNVSVCDGSGQWTPPALSCAEILCGDPPALPHTGQVWNGSSTPGSTATYHCNVGLAHSEGHFVSVCTTNGSWTKPKVSCKEVDCGVPPSIPHSLMLWDRRSTVGSRVVYRCQPGYRNVGRGNVSVCTSSGDWDGAFLLCREIRCREPVFKAGARTLWDGASRVGSVAYYQCHDGFHSKSLRNYSVCGANGQWEDIDLWCEEISCGLPLSPPHTNLLWDRTSRPGSVVLYECMDGFYLEGGTNMSVCSVSGVWGDVSVSCKAKCGPVPVLAHSEVVWHNRSVVVHRCVDGFHSWRGSSVSVCGSSGVWREATLRCIERRLPISHMFVVKEKCVKWKAEKYTEDAEVYKVTYTGSRDFQKSFRDKRRQFVSSKAEQLELCLNLRPVTNYSISITAVSARFTATIAANTSLAVPPAPAVRYREFETPVPTLRLRRSVNTLDPISLYQVFVLPGEGILVFDCASPGSPDPLSTSQSSAGYITAQVRVLNVGTEMNFTVGDGLHYGGFYNAPLENGRNYYIILRAVSQWKTSLKSTCVLWAKVRGSSYASSVAALSAFAAVGLTALVLLGGYTFIWCFRKT